MTPEKLLLKLNVLQYFIRRLEVYEPDNTEYYSRWMKRLNNYKLKLIQQTKSEWERNRTLYILEKYNSWILKEGYTDTDIIYELDINEFLNTLNVPES